MGLDVLLDEQWSVTPGQVLRCLGQLMRAVRIASSMNLKFLMSLKCKSRKWDRSLQTLNSEL